MKAPPCRRARRPAASPQRESASPHGRGAIASSGMAMQRLAEEEARQQGGDERRGAEHDQHVGDRREAERQDEGDHAAGQQRARSASSGAAAHCARRSRSPRRCQNSSGSIVSIIRTERQNDTSHAGSSMRRTMTPAVLKTAAAANGAGHAERAGTLAGNRRFHWQTNCEYGVGVPPSIDSLDLPPFKPRFPWWGADLQTLSVLLQSSASDMSPHTQRARLLSDGRSHRRHPARHARPSRGTAWPTGRW